MRKKMFKRMISTGLTACLCASMIPISALAATNVTPVPNSSNSAATLPVEYFNSTLYNWNEALANAATSEVDYVTNDGSVQGYYNVQKTTATDAITWYDLAPSKTTRTATGYYVQLTGDGNYYETYITYKSGSYSLEYKISDDSYKTVASYSSNNPKNNWPADLYNVGTFTTIGDNTICLYEYGEIDGYYEGKGFYFTGAENKLGDVPSFSSWSGSKQNYYIYSGLAETKLSESTNAPFDNENVNAADLFSDTEYDWKDVYKYVGVPYVYDASTGYYVLNSDIYGVYFAGGEGAFGTSEGALANMLIADKPVAFYSSADKIGTGFQPFEDVSTTTTTEAYLSTSNETTTAYAIADDTDLNDMYAPTYGFGMKTEVKFQMTDDGKSAVTGEDITFEFSGDDDVWVYIDGVLALDIGGTHDAIVGTINFASGNVTLTAPAYETIGDKALDPELDGTNIDGSSVGSTLSQTNLYTALGKTLTQFASEGEHTLTVYYMDRGQGRTNCILKFNLPQKDTVTVTKNITHSKNDAGVLAPLTEKEQANIDNIDFGFTLYKNGDTVGNKAYYVYNAVGDLLRTASTNSAGYFTLKNGETARFNVEIVEDDATTDAVEKDTYYVVEDNVTANGFKTPSYTYSTVNASNVSVVDAAGLASMKVSASGSSSAADNIAIVCENFLDENLPNPSIYPTNDTIVIDYGLPINIENVLANDVWRGDKIELISVQTTGTYGAAVLGTDGSITYTLNKPLTGIETLTYSVKVTGSGNVGTETTTATATANGTITIIPATSMYYEENFSNMVAYSQGNVVWDSINDGKTYGTYQETGIVGTTTDSTYGTDAVYLNNLGDSYGTSKKANANGNYGAQFEYDFTGTGTAIYGRISQDTGYIQVTITHVEDEETVTDELQYIDTAVLGNVATSETLYNIPIYNNAELDYGTYHVRVYLYKAGTPTASSTDGSGAEFYLDGIRVYNPLVDNATAETAYANDGEANTKIINIRDKVVADYEADWTTNTEGTFVTLTDLYGDNATGALVSVDAYTSYGPNQELYLYDTADTVSFCLINWDSQLYKLYLGMKAPNGTAAEVTVGNQEMTLDNSADCYYDISNYIESKTVTVNGETYTVGTVVVTGESGLVSLTNLKVTGIDEFNLGYSTDIQEEGDGTEDDVEGNADIEVASFSLLRTASVSEEATEVVEEESSDVSTTYAIDKNTLYLVSTAMVEDISEDVKTPESDADSDTDVEEDADTGVNKPDKLDKPHKGKKPGKPMPNHKFKSGKEHVKQWIVIQGQKKGNVGKKR